MQIHPSAAGADAGTVIITTEQLLGMPEDQYMSITQLRFSNRSCNASSVRPANATARHVKPFKTDLRSVTFLTGPALKKSERPH